MNLLVLLRTGLLAAALAAVPAFAVNRTVVITAPPASPPGSSVQVTVTASTDAPDSEQVGFLHAEYSIDNGKTWKSAYSDKTGRTVTRVIDFKAGPGGSTAQVRARVAFRGGKAGDVDYTGAPIKWGESWDKWGSPPAKVVTIPIKTR